MAEYTFYCKIFRDYPLAGIKAGVYSYTSEAGRRTSLEFTLIQFSEKVWRQGPHGGVKIIKDRGINGYYYGYVTNDEEEMKKFMWAKLQARAFK